MRGFDPGAGPKFRAAQQASDPTTALTTYKKFLKLFPDDPSAPYAKQQIKTLNSQVGSSSSG